MKPELLFWGTMADTKELERIVDFVVQLSSCDFVRQERNNKPAHNDKQRSIEVSDHNELVEKMHIILWAYLGIQKERCLRFRMHSH